MLMTYKLLLWRLVSKMRGTAVFIIAPDAPVREGRPAAILLTRHNAALVADPKAQLVGEITVHPSAIAQRL